MFKKPRLTPIEVVEATAEKLSKSDSPYDRFAGRVALLEPIEFHRHDSILDGTLFGYSRWSFAYTELSHRERNVYKDVTRHLWVGKKVGQMMLTANFFSISSTGTYSSILQRLPYARHASLHGTRDGVYGDLELLDEASQMVEDIEIGVMSQEHPTLQSYRSLAETYRGDDPEQKRLYEEMAADAAKTFHPNYDLEVRGRYRKLLGWDD